MSIRLRLTLLYSAIIGLTLVLFSLALYFTLSRVSVEVLRQSLAAEAAQLARDRGRVFIRRAHPRPRSRGFCRSPAASLLRTNRWPRSGRSSLSAARSRRC